MVRVFNNLNILINSALVFQCEAFFLIVFRPQYPIRGANYKTIEMKHLKLIHSSI